MSYPTSELAMFLLNFTTILAKLAGGILFLYVLIIFLPLIIQIFLNMLISMVRYQLRFDIRPLLDLLFFPGSILRMTIIWLILKRNGFEYRLGFVMPDAGESASMINRRYRGLTFYSFQPKEKQEEISVTKLALKISLASYSVLPIVVILIMFSSPIIISMYYIFPAHLVIPMFNFGLISLALGGLPVPEETLAVLYTTIYSSPHLIISTLINILAAMIFAPYVGPAFGLAIFLSIEVIHLMIYISGKDDIPELDEQLQDRDLKLAAMSN